MAGLGDVIRKLVAASGRQQQTYTVDGKLQLCQIAAVMAYIKIIFPDYKLTLVQDDDDDVDERVHCGELFGTSTPFVELIGSNTLIVQNLEEIGPDVQRSLQILVGQTMQTCGCVLFKHNAELRPYFLEARQSLYDR